MRRRLTLAARLSAKHFANGSRAHSGTIAVRCAAMQPQQRCELTLRCDGRRPLRSVRQTWTLSSASRRQHAKRIQTINARCPRHSVRASWWSTSRANQTRHNDALRRHALRWIHRNGECECRARNASSIAAIRGASSRMVRLPRVGLHERTSRIAYECRRRSRPSQVQMHLLDVRR